MQGILLLLSIGTVLFEIGPEVGGFLFVLDAGKDHLGVRNLGAWVFDVFLESLLVPGDAGIFVGVGIIEIWRCARMTAVNTIEYWPHLVLGAFADGMAGEALLEGLFAGRHVLSLRDLNHRGHDYGRRKYRFHYLAPVVTFLKPPPSQHRTA